ncbi:MAG: cytochrome c maturation protein CcmE [Alphaproteobacteria bacterium]|nr:cytochrome c maturation protein CcmE [Alphaproteobacteria bacterium]MCW5753000.1 cytochrome c maturation protein CcmE [Alphaproteobacteria bacterium]
MTRKRRRLYVLIAALASLGVASALVLVAFQDNLVFFYSPSDLQTKSLPADQRIRIGGLVEAESVMREGLTTRFRVTDTAHSIAVSYTGLLPDLFREGQGVVANGKLGPGGVFIADEILAKHDENYMPPEVADAIKRTGQWKPEGSR